jgi:predicted ATP-dependent serine protease
MKGTTNMDLKINSTAFVDIKDVTIPSIFYKRMNSGIEQLDALFGNGLLPGSSITVAARAGLGKTTLMLQLLQGLVNTGHEVGYCSNEESIEQLAMTCKRLNVNNIRACNEAEVDTISSYMDKFDVIVVDSLQGLSKEGLTGRSLEKYCIEKLIKRAKETECVLILICHNTKAGQIKGSSLILHAVDVNMSIEPVKEAEINARRIVFNKNRFGPANDLECFIQQNGYDFESEVSLLSEGKSHKPSKKKLKNEQRQQILAMPSIQVKAICKALQIDATRANFLLRELQQEGLIEKQGRGADATWLVAVAA